MNINTFNNTTYITTDNQIQGELEFKTQNNIGTVLKAISQSISKMFNYINKILTNKGE